MISIVIGLGLVVIIASIFILKLSFEIKDLRTDLEHARVKERLLVDYIDTLNKQAATKKVGK